MRKTKEECLQCYELPEGQVVVGHDHRPRLTPEELLDSFNLKGKITEEHAKEILQLLANNL